MSDKRSSRPGVGVGVLIWRDTELLLGRRILDDASICWQFPGGHLEHGESVIDCAVREVLEETGLKVKDLRHFGFTDRAFSVAAKQYITLLVSCDYECGEAQALEPDKCDAWQWFDYQQLPKPLFEPIQIFLSQQHELYALHRSSPVMPSTAEVTKK